MIGMSPPFIVLYNYGGGLRGLIPAYIMNEIEKRTGLRMAEMVDVFAGPSTGSILNAALNIRDPDTPDKPKYRARHLIRFYMREGANIFPFDRFRQFRGFVRDFNNRTMKIGQLNRLMRHGHYDTSQLHNSLQQLFGDAKLSHSLSSLVIPFYDIAGTSLNTVKEKDETNSSPVHTRNNLAYPGGKGVWMKHIHPHAEAPPPPPPHSVSLFDAVMASCSAPTYFPCHHFYTRDPVSGQVHENHAIDGSIFDNPCVSYHGTLRRHVPAGHDLHMICLGTGVVNKPITKEEWDEFGPIGVVDPANDYPLINIFFQASESALINSFAEDLGHRLFVFNESLHGHYTDPRYPSTSIDNATPENLARMKRFAYMMMENRAADMDDMCHLLVTNRDRKHKEKRSFFKDLQASLRHLGFGGGDDTPG